MSWLQSLLWVLWPKGREQMAEDLICLVTLMGVIWFFVP